MLQLIEDLFECLIVLLFFVLFVVVPIAMLFHRPRNGYVFGILLSFLLLGASVGIAGGSFAQFWDAPSLLWVVDLLIAFIIASGRERFFLDGLRAAVNDDYQHEKAEEIAAFFTRLFWAMIGIGLLGTMLGGLLMLNNLDPRLVGTGVSVALLTLFYALFFGIVFILPIAAGFRRAAEKKNEPAE